MFLSDGFRRKPFQMKRVHWEAEESGEHSVDPEMN